MNRRETDKEIGASDAARLYTVLERKDISPEEEIVLCDRGQYVTPHRYATWRRDKKMGATYHGNYFPNVMDASVDFLRRTGQ